MLWLNVSVLSNLSSNFYQAGKDYCVYPKWPIKRPRYLLKNKSFCVASISNWVLNWTKALTKKFFLKKSVRQVNISQKSQNSLGLFSFGLNEGPVVTGCFNWLLKRTWVLIKILSPNTEILRSWHEISLTDLNQISIERDISETSQIHLRKYAFFVTSLRRLTNSSKKMSFMWRP